MRLDDLARDREAKASAANVAVSEAFHAVERVEDVVQRLARNPDAIVLNAHLEQPCGVLRAETVICPPRGLYLRAFDSRLPSTCWMRSGSAMAIGRS